MKVIIETALLTDDEKVKACVLCKAAGADFVKTSTGFGRRRHRRRRGPHAARGRADMGVKAAGGVNDLSPRRP